MKNVFNLLPGLEVFKNIKEALKQARVTLCRIDVLHHCNRFLVHLNSIFGELKESY